jgi:hypothetical protein
MTIFDVGLQQGEIRIHSIVTGKIVSLKEFLETLPTLSQEEQLLISKYLRKEGFIE